MSVYADEYLEAEAQPSPASRPASRSFSRPATRPSGGTRPSAGTRPDTSRSAASTVQSVLSLFQRAAPLVQQGWNIAQQFRRRPPARRPAPARPPSPYTPPAAHGPSAAHAPAAPYNPPAAHAPASDPLSLLRTIIGNPYVQQALQGAPQHAPRAVSLPMPAAAGQGSGPQQMDIPLGAVLNAIYALAGQGMEQVNANTREDDPEVPEYLVGDDGEFLVDPASASERAQLVAELFQVSEDVQAQLAADRWGRTR